MNFFTVLFTTLLLTLFSIKGCLGNERRRREASEDRLEMKHEQRENNREDQFRHEVRKTRSDELKDDNVDDLFMSEEDASSFMRRDRDNYDESVEERADRLREVEENRREDASKTPKERSREKRENTRERKYEL